MLVTVLAGNAGDGRGKRGSTVTSTVHREVKNTGIDVSLKANTLNFCLSYHKIVFIETFKEVGL